MHIFWLIHGLSQHTQNGYFHSFQKSKVHVHKYVHIRLQFIFKEAFASMGRIDKVSPLWRQVVMLVPYQQWNRARRGKARVPLGVAILHQCDTYAQGVHA